MRERACDFKRRAQFQLAAGKRSCLRDQRAFERRFAAGEVHFVRVDAAAFERVRAAGDGHLFRLHGPVHGHGAAFRPRKGSTVAVVKVVFCRAVAFAQPELARVARFPDVRAAVPDQRDVAEARDGQVVIRGAVGVGRLLHAQAGGIGRHRVFVPGLERGKVSGHFVRLRLTAIHRADARDMQRTG